MATRTQSPAKPGAPSAASVAATSGYSRRARGVWSVIIISTFLFCAACAASGTGVYGYLSSVMRSQSATLRVVHRGADAGEQVSVKRRLRPEAEAVEDATTVNEGDAVRIGPETEAELELFDASIAHLYFGSDVTLTRLQTSRFLGSVEEVGLRIDAGTLVLSTPPLETYSQASYTLQSPHAEISVESNSTVRVKVDGQSSPPSTQVIVSFGQARVMSQGKSVELRPGQMTAVEADSPPTDARAEEQNLIRNGSFTEPPTSGAEYLERGGLGTAAWLPIRSQSVENTVDNGTVQVVTETVGSTVYAAVIKRNAPGEQYARVGLRQEIHAPASFLRQIELRLKVKVVQQTEVPGGPRGDVFPLTVAVLYTDYNDNSKEWRHSFYLGSGDAAELPNATRIRQAGAWESLTDWEQDKTEGAPPEAQEFVLRQLDGTTPADQDIAVINAIEIYGIGTEFQSWVTDVALLAR